MRNTRWRAFGALAAVAALTLSACGGGESGDGDDGGSDSGAAVTPEFNAALDEVYNPSESTGGIIKAAHSSDWDTLDPGETYYGFSWNFARLYGRSLLMFKAAPGDESNELVPDLAEDLGEASDDGKTWTYKIRQGVKYEDGTEVTAQDVKYAVLRSTDKATFPNGPAYFEAFLDLPEGYEGPYKTPDMDTDSAIETPDDYTIVFHLKQPFSGFDYMAQLTQTMPVPEDKDSGAEYRDEIVSTGPYKFEGLEPGKGFSLVRNDQWDAETDPNRTALPDGWDVQLNVNADDIDQRLQTGDLQVDLAGTGVQPAAMSQVLSDPAKKAMVDNPTIARLWYTSINPTVPPLDNIECRKAIMFAMDHKSYQTAYGGEFAGGDLATTIMPPQIPGYEEFDTFPAGETGDLDAAQEALDACGQPDGFETSMAFRSDRPKEEATAEAFQQALDRVGIKVNLKGYPAATYFSENCGLPPFVVKNELGLCTNGWGADWNDGFGFLSQIVDSRVIRETGGSSNTSVRIPEVDTMLDEALLELDDAAREADWTAIDKRVMEEAVIYPGVYAKSVLVRGQGLTNVFVNNSFGMYDYMSMGTE
ncbi:MAG: ABC transporter substrate-binding protein [Nocardioides sp.]